MENPEAKSKWDDLVRELAVEIPPEVQQREETVASAPPKTAAPPGRPRETPPAPLPKRSATNWNSLASDLGLPPSEEPEPIAAAAPATPELPKPVPRSEPREREQEQSRGRRPERQDRERPAREGQEQERPPRREQRERSEQPREGRGRRGQRGGRPDHRKRDDEGERGRGREREHERDQDREREPEPTLRPEPEIERAAAEPETPREQPPQKPAGVSLWHKIFGSPTEQTAKLVEEESREETVAPSNFRDEPRSAGSGFADTHPDERLEVQEGAGEFDRHDEPSGTSDESEQSEQRRGRPRRRRGGRGRGRKPEERRPESRSTVRRDEERPSRPPRPERQERQESDDDEFDDEPLIDDDDTDEELDDSGSETMDGNGELPGEGPSRGTSVLQRSIPSWDEAIGFIVDTNMQTRSQRRPAPRSGSRDNSQRGRSRGRRKN